MNSYSVHVFIPSEMLSNKREYNSSHVDYIFNLLRYSLKMSICICLQAFVTCPLGSWWVGYVAICYGVVDAICSASFGKLVQYFGRIPFFILGKNILYLLIVASLLLK